jgi:transposase
MEQAVTRQHAHQNTVFHCLYGYYCLGYSRQELANIYNKCTRTISNWIQAYENTGTYERTYSRRELIFNDAHRRWLFTFFERHPLAYLDEAKSAFTKAHCLVISVSSVWRIIHEMGLTRKVLERRAMHIKEKDIFRFVNELSRIDWCHHNLVFLDEVSFDNRGMIRRRGYALKGKKLAIRGDFQRLPRVSMLAFLGVDGIIDFSHTEGTFDRVKFVRRCRRFAYSKRGFVRQYPGQHSVWIMDGATIHRHPEIVHWLRSLGIVVIFLPAYCPFFNPIEFIFGYIKKAFQRHYKEDGTRDVMPFVVETMQRFEAFDMTRVFAHCGWKVNGVFDPRGPMAYDQGRVPDIWEETTELEEEDLALGFSVRQ